MRRRGHDTIRQQTESRGQVFGQQASKQPRMRQPAVKLKLMDEMIDWVLIGVQGNSRINRRSWRWQAPQSAMSDDATGRVGRSARRHCQGAANPSASLAKIEVVVPPGLA
jgi:hypothetical protein